MRTSAIFLSALAATASAAALPPLGHGPVVTCYIQAFTTSDCKGNSTEVLRLSPDDKCIDVSKYHSFNVTGFFCPRGATITEHQLPDCPQSSSAAMEPLYKLTHTPAYNVSNTAGCQKWKGALVHSISVHEN